MKLQYQPRETAVSFMVIPKRQILECLMKDKRKRGLHNQILVSSPHLYESNRILIRRIR